MSIVIWHLVNVTCSHKRYVLRLDTWYNPAERIPSCNHDPIRQSAMVKFVQGPDKIDPYTACPMAS